MQTSVGHPTASVYDRAPMATRHAVTGADPRSDLEAALEAHRTELTGFCYRMLGSGSEAEDAVQETMVRAWRAIDGFEGRSSLRSWLYRIANNVCIDMVRSPQRRARPMEMGPSSPTAEIVLSERYQPEHAFVQPVADERVIRLDTDPAEVAAARESVRLAFVAALQHLPARQRSVLILCEVLRWQASEAAELLDTSVASVNSALQRARATLAEHRTDPLDSTVDPEHQALLTRYVDAFERYDISDLVGLVREDVVMSMPPWDVWLEGPEEMAAFFLGEGSVCRDGRLLPVAVNGTGGFGNYHKVGEGVWEPWAIQVIEVSGGKIVGHHNFVYPELFPAFGLPSRLEA
jgi:RNA polymerase sigma-70 factor, ECF subfamily